ncbi:MAG TPA: DUF364 domain-containing protein [Anaerolineales bacterium]|nr:DUF364 domain-containing protein [Anaerolineales bacterium]
MTIASEILSTLPDGEILQACIGTHWTAVVARVGGEQRCGLASTNEQVQNHSHEAIIPEAGRLEELPARKVAGWVESDVPLRRSLGAAAVNALLPRPPQPWRGLHAVDAIARLGAGKSVALVGHFAFAPKLREQVGRLWILERNPQPGDEPEEAASDLLPQADVIAITGASFVNGSLESLLHHCRPESRVVLLGPSTPFSEVLFRHGVHVLSGAVVESPDPILRAVSQSANFHQLRAFGVRLVTVTAPGIEFE